MRRIGNAGSLATALAAAVGAILAAAVTPQARADSASSVAGAAVAAGTGAAVYQHVCQGCHMANGRGAEGAGAGFPSFAGNAKLADSGYPIYVVLNGMGGMPWFNGALSDAQIAAVVAYIRTHFGNHYATAVKPTDVADVRGPAPTMER